MDAATIEMDLPESGSLDWEQAIGALLSELSAAQDELLDVLKEKRQLLASGNIAGLEEINRREGEVLARLQRCHDERARLLQQAADDGDPASTLRARVNHLPAMQAAPIRQRLDAAESRTRFLQHQCLTNWVLAQQSLVHLSQLIELIATGGQRQPTYSNGAPSCATGTLVDQEA
jgi:flagellar biosynthesis/type III secretory pathway chaperone